MVTEAVCAVPPELLTTVIVLVPVGVPGEIVLVPPPQPMTPTKIPQTAVASNNLCAVRLFLRPILVTTSPRATLARVNLA